MINWYTKLIKNKEMRDKRMAQLWGGRFTKETDKLVYNFNASLSFDSKLYKQDITGSMAHCCQNNDHRQNHQPFS